ncbi:uncharacterized protein Z518_02448 [Rhinocladiella mackenziei CBS 650.93]|uniref:Rhinocladiella mackenziei CBS 650.93 unplaced genomic scaffold supercont1.2, whole genome shotgun sequence n=1 Tax=Rhinocladiella mackenziei CBS 650.93 TaxID=1442369 RepID=A0A0D2IPH7_9EURO|nr:uncharacterized protein Z518_02448 [Rhinocladiella mackenziei CBS 650.93]KIX07794.1 hypothetical protein Z518_02448 [Rhinocladiella mackenziei CBS 650.93]
MSSQYEGLLGKSEWTEIGGICNSETTIQQQPRVYQTLEWLASTAKQSLSRKRNSRINKLGKTAWLDGLRGFAALLVYFLHHEVWAHSSLILENAYGYDNQYYMACLPVLRTFFSGGHFAVSVFFVISGYVLSIKPRDLIYSGDHERLADSLASALFRRWLRLYIPVICTTAITASMPHIFGIKANFAPERTWRDEMWKWYCEFKNFSFAFRLGGEPWFSYSFHVWSIPFEFRGSICVYTALLAFSRCTTSARLWCQVTLIFYFLYIADGAHFAMFTVGMLLCDLDHLSEQQRLPKWTWGLKKFQKPIFYFMFMLGILLGGCPSHHLDIQVLNDSPGWRHLAFLVPQAVFDYKWFFLFWSATFTVASIPKIPWLRSVFESRFCQYLGRISFAFYLVHGPVLWTLGERLYAATGWSKDWQINEIPGWIDRFPLPRVGPLGMELNFLVPHLILLPVTFWVAEIATAAFDEPSINLSRWLYSVATAKGRGGQKHEWKSVNGVGLKR